MLAHKNLGASLWPLGLLLAIVGGCGSPDAKAPVVAKVVATSKPAPPPPEGWKTLKVAADNFQVSIPQKTENTKMPIDSDLGKLDVNMIMASVGDPEINYAIMTIEYPEQADKMETQSMLDNGRDAFVKDGRTLVSEGQIELDGHAGRELVVTAKDSDGKTDLRYDMRFYIINRRLYQLFTINIGKERPPLASEFLDSFRLLKPVENTRG